MTKEELLRIALSGKTNKSYKQALGFDECEKFLDGFNLTLNEGPHIPVWIVYLFYYRWVTASKKKPENYSVFVRTWGKHTRSIPFSDQRQHIHFRAYKIKGFPPYTLEDELIARKLIREQKEKIRKKKLPTGKRRGRPSKKVFQPKSQI
jgi:hypothetical protein